MGHLSILMRIQVHYNEDTFTGLEFVNFTFFDQKCFKICLKNKNNLLLLIT